MTELAGCVDAPESGLYLPKPTGSHPVGATLVHLTDVSRRDPWAPEATSRELMVSLWYPAQPSGGPRAPYLTPTESELLLKHAGITGLPFDVLSTTRTNAVTDATPIECRHDLPLVVLSPSFTKPCATLTALAEDLASHGYVVAGIEHTYESVATTFPDGRVTTCRAREVRQRGHAFWERLTASRAADVSFVLDALTGTHPQSPGARLIDPSRIAMAGHSVGGASTIAAIVTDSRLRAGIDIDGATHFPISDAGLPRPFLFLGRKGQCSPGGSAAAATWERDWNHLTGWKRWLVVGAPSTPPSPTSRCWPSSAVSTLAPTCRPPVPERFG
ncbi:MAG TPA: alpha/beta hydrolase [Actinophytocola sp.]|nr:alpha/beta hydrolase [Actinophytocola sp.]